MRQRDRNKLGRRRREEGKTEPVGKPGAFGLLFLCRKMTMREQYPTDTDDSDRPAVTPMMQNVIVSYGMIAVQRYHVNPIVIHNGCPEDRLFQGKQFLRITHSIPATFASPTNFSQTTSHSIAFFTRAIAYSVIRRPG